MFPIIYLNDKGSRPERFIAGFILFYCALVFCLPVPNSAEIAARYPWWSKRIAIGNVRIHELLFIGWILLFGRRFVLQSFLKGHIPTRQAVVWLIALALWCGFISLSAPLPWLDVGRTLRLLLNAILILAIVNWTRKMGSLSLGMLVLGFLIGTIINLAISYQYPLIINRMMRLSGQNTPGVAMGVAIHLTAWLFFRSNDSKWQILSILSTLIFVFGCAISFSRIGWFIGGSGSVAWIYVLFIARTHVRQRQRLKKARIITIFLMSSLFMYLQFTPIGSELFHWVGSLVLQKFTVSASQGEGDRTRKAYVVGTAEILLQSPFGVGYSGFYDAMTATDVYYSGKAAKEVSLVDANPHASFLWYTTAGGIPGGLMSFMVFLMLLNSMRYGLVTTMGRSGFVLFVLITPSFLLIGLTVPYLFNSPILIAPAAIAAGWGFSYREIQFKNRL